MLCQQPPRFLLLLLSIWLIPTAIAQDQKQDRKQEIVLGTTTAISGPAKFLGKSMVRGIQAHLAEINSTGGVHGKSLRLVVLDDSYHPPSAEKNMLRLINEHNVLSVVGNVGTPTAVKTIPLAMQHNTLLFGTFSGAGILRKSPPDRYVINYRASYEEEMAHTVRAILDHGITADEIAFFTQEDAYGDSGYQSAIKSLTKLGFKHGDKLSHGRYTRNTLHVEQGLLRILEGPVKPRAIIIVGTYAPAARFIKLARDVFPNVRFFNLSFISSEALATALHGIDAHVYVSQVVPPLDSTLPGVDDYRHAMQQYYPDSPLDAVSLEGYWVSRILVEGIRKAGKTVNRETLVDALESMEGLDIGSDETIRFDNQEHQASHRVWLSKFQKDRFVSASWDKL